MRLWTVGHSNRAWDDFLALLQGEKRQGDERQGEAIGALADVRRFPSSRKHPQFNGEQMARALAGAGIERLLRLAGRKRTAIMCAEAVWWQCHRALISDYLQSRGIDVFHIVSAGSEAAKHPYSSAATLIDGRLSYSGAQPRLL